MLLLHPRSWGIHLLAVVALAAAVLLGLWQYDAWRDHRAAEARDLSGVQPVPLAQVMTGDDPFPGRDVGRPVRLTGRWLADSTLFVSDRHRAGRTGYWVVTPVLVGDSAMPVVRGWSARPTAAAPPAGPAEVTGWLQPGEGTGALDEDPDDREIPEMRIASLTQLVDADLYSGFVVSRTPDGDLAAVTPRDIPEISATTALRNLLYALEWWFFGLFAVYVWARWCRDTLADARSGSVQEPSVTSGA